MHVLHEFIANLMFIRVPFTTVSIETNPQGFYCEQLRAYFLTGVISQLPAYSDVQQDGAFQSSVTVTSTITSQVIVGNGSLEKSKDSARESAARSACNKLMTQRAAETQERAAEIQPEKGQNLVPMPRHFVTIKPSVHTGAW